MILNRIKNKVLILLASFILLAAMDGFSSLIQTEDGLSGQVELLEDLRTDEGSTKFRTYPGLGLDLFIPVDFFDFSFTLAGFQSTGSLCLSQGDSIGRKLFILYSSLVFYS